VVVQRLGARSQARPIHSESEPPDKPPLITLARLHCHHSTAASLLPQARFNHSLSSSTFISRHAPKATALLHSTVKIYGTNHESASPPITVLLTRYHMPTDCTALASGTDKGKGGNIKKKGAQLHHLVDKHCRCHRLAVSVIVCAPKVHATIHSTCINSRVRLGIIIWWSSHTRLLECAPQYHLATRFIVCRTSSSSLVSPPACMSNMQSPCHCPLKFCSIIGTSTDWESV
jgi:hypothetical protein